MRHRIKKSFIYKIAFAVVPASSLVLLLLSLSHILSANGVKNAGRTKRVGPKPGWEKGETDPVPKIGKPVTQFPAVTDSLNKDPLFQLTAPKRLKGVLLYGQAPYGDPKQAAYWEKREKEKDFRANEWDVGYNAIASLALRTIDQGTSTTTAYRMEINGGQYLIGAEFSRDGQQVLLKMGWPFDQNGMFSVYVADLKTGKAKRVARFLSYQEVLLSPDGNYIAFIRGGTVLGDNLGSSKPLSLSTVNLQTGKEHMVVSDNSATAGGWAWTPRNTLVYSVLKPNPERRKSPPNGTTKKDPKLTLVPTLYEVPAAGGKAKLLLRDAWRPVLSPDGKRLAFFGSENPLKPESLSSYWQENPQGASLCVADIDGNNRKALNREQGSYPTVLWKTDSEHLISLKTISVGNRSTIFAVDFDIETGKMRPITRLVSQDAQALPRPSLVVPPFTPLHLSNDENYLIATTESLSEKIELKTGLYTRFTTVLEINLATGEALAIARLKNAWGIDWRDESKPTSMLTTSPVPQ